MPTRRTRAEPALAHIVHNVVGRTRLRVPGRRRDQAFFDDLSGHLSGLRGVASVETSPLTASVIVHHDWTPDEAGQRLATGDRLRLDDADHGHGSGEKGPVAGITDRLRDTLAAGDAWMHTATRGTVDVAMALFIVFTITGMVQLARGRVGIPAMSAFWYALGALMLARQIRGAPPGGDRPDGTPA